MDITVSTPALIFPAVSLLFLSYTNRFLALSSLVRRLHSEWQDGDRDAVLLAQIKNLSKRLTLIRLMQMSGALSLLSSVISMISLFLGFTLLGEIAFGTALVVMLISLIALVVESAVSGGALRIMLDQASKSHNT
ncbi:MAG: DUF2721 domain-containing protein [Rubritalea sp.]|mgnify:CR=1 FL=1|jgi:hypothetical protein|tara:strand:- start:25405 stop:25809 length:405 start_codon:yes stop_codon:yes gene_type:complete